MSRTTHLPLVLVATLLLAGGCTTLTRDDCLTNNWYAIGVQDGLAGAPRTRFNHHARFCQRFGVQANLVAYDMGRERGLAEFCVGADDLRSLTASPRYQLACTRSPEDPLITSPTTRRAQLRGLGVEAGNILDAVPRF
ncbi:MAG TPA: DUF2799 domain-containing protein [Gammaproteobacteria bacterium]|nr:DUF2799 domain-containing protein [Gammaproteobacteria bacterium]